MLKVFLLIAELLMSSILITFFPAVLRTSQYLPLCSGSRGDDTQCEHFTLPLAGTIICANFSFTFIDLTLANVLDDRSTILRGKVPNLFHAYCQRLKYILLCCSLRYFLLLHRKVSHQAGYFLSFIGPMNF